MEQKGPRTGHTYQERSVLVLITKKKIDAKLQVYTRHYKEGRTPLILITNSGKIVFSRHRRV